MATEKSRLVNAADGAAYSGAVWAARNMNFMAYTNRAMIANHVAVGHYVSYVSWTRYVEEAASKINKISPILHAMPGGTVIAQGLVVVERTASTTKSISERFAPIFIRAADSLNEGLSLAQSAAHISMASHASLTPQAEIMRAAARVYDADIRVNNPTDLGVLRSLGVAVDLAAETGDLQTFIKSYSAGDTDSGRMVQFAADSFGSSRGFLEERGWGTRFIYVGSVKKSASTTQSLGRHADWVSNDKFEYKWPGGKWQTLADKSASAGEFTNGRYNGITNYFDLGDTSPDANTVQRFAFTAYATMPISRARLSNLMGLDTTAQRMAAISRAELFYQRPTEGFSPFNGSSGEYANVFNPFWEARLTEAPREMLQGVL
jgi:hypothetical protein